MKTRSILSLIVLIFIATTVKSQDTDKRFVLKTNPFAAIASGIWYGPIIPLTAELPRITFEYGQGNHGFMLSGGYLGWSLIGNLGGATDEEYETVNDVISNRGFKTQGIYKYYFSGTAPSGFYIGPHMSFSYAKMTDREFEEDYVSGTNLILSAAIGYQYISEGGFAFDIFTGFGYQQKDWITSGEGADIGQEDEVAGYNGLKIPLVINFGYAF